MNSGLTVINSFSQKEYPHSSMANDSIKIMVDRFDFITNMLFLSIVARLILFEVIVISVDTYAHVGEQPAKFEFFLVFLDESISH